MNKAIVVMSFEQYATSQGCSRLLFPPSFMRSTKGMSDIALRRAKAAHKRYLEDWQAGRDRVRVKYEALVAAGDIKVPSRIERLQRKAKGHPDNTSTQAARRILDKRGEP